MSCTELTNILLPSTLILGMIQLKVEETKKLKSESPIYRDTNRLKSLSQLIEDSILTISKEEVHDFIYHPFHIETTISTRGAKKIKKLYPHLQLKCIIGDYFRFPSAYFYQAYLHVFEFLFQLYKDNILDPKIKIFLPLLPEHKDQTHFFFHPLKHMRDIFEIKFGGTQDNPLVKATSLLSNEKLGGYINDKQISLLHPNHPFLVLSLKKKNLF